MTSSAASWTSTFAVAELPETAAVGFQPRGGALALWRSKDHEVVLSGPAETGKTYACCQKLDALLWKYPRSSAVVVRKYLSSLYPSVFQTYKTVLGPNSPVLFYGGEKPEWADYPNGSRVYFTGMDNPQKALSSERDFVYVNQLAELDLNDWEVLTTRCTGRAANAPYPQLFGDCNPGAPTHWILARESLVKLESRHRDNPTLYDDAGELTERGARTMAVLEALTGVRRGRLYLGQWVGVEGQVYPGFDPAIHVVDPRPIPASWRRIRSIDFGYVNPFVCQWWAVDPDGGMWLYREVYHTGRTVRVHAEQIKRLSVGERITETVADHDAEDRATLAESGITTTPAQKALTVGIQAVEERLKVAGHGKPRLHVLRNVLVERDPALADARQPVCTLDEWPCYVWPQSAGGKPIKEVPVDRDNHGMDALRYAVMAVDHPMRMGFA